MPLPNCSMPNCNREIYKNNLCKRHYELALARFNRRKEKRLLTNRISINKHYLDIELEQNKKKLKERGIAV